MSSPIKFVQISETHGFGTALSVALSNVTAGNTLVVYTAGSSRVGGNLINLNDTFSTNINNVITIARGDDAAPTTATLGAGAINSSGLDVVSATFGSVSDFHFLAAAEYSGVIIDSLNNVVFDQSSFIGQDASNANITLPIKNTSWIISVPFFYRPITSSGQSTGSLRVFDGGPSSVYGLAWFDNTFGNISFQYSSTVFSWTASIGLAGVAIPLTPQLPASIWPDRVTTHISKSDRIYPYSSFSVVPTSLTPIPFVCPHCRVGSQAMIYRDVRDYSVAVGIPNTLHGGIKKGASFDFIYCGSCSYWYRKNDYKRVRNINIVDFGINPNLDPGGNTTTAFLGEPETYEAQSNIADDTVRVASNINLNGFVDQFERPGFTVIPIATGSNDLF